MIDRSTDLLNNIRELVRAWRNSNDAIFTLHWKRVWPFRLFWPQVDYPRLGRILTTCQSTAAEQVQFLERELAKQGGSQELRDFYLKAKAYVAGISQAAELLCKLTEYRQAVLERKQVHRFREWDNLVVQYRKSADTVTELASHCQLSYLSLQASRQAASGQ